MIQLLLHLLGDYIFQSHWMATQKTKHWWPALCHATIYSAPFLLIGSWAAVGFIFGTHYLIDRFRLIRYVIWAKNIVVGLWIQKLTELEKDPFGLISTMHSEELSWANCQGTGYPSETPAWLAVWLMICADNTLHLCLNFLSLYYL